MSSASKIGLPPGSLVYTGDNSNEEVSVHSIVYTKTSLKQESGILRPRANQKLWLNINGVHDTEVVKEIGKAFKLHPLVIEDIANPNQRPKLEDYGSFLFLELNLIDYDKNSERLYKEQIAIIIGKNFVITFQESVQDVFQMIAQRLVENAERLREQGVDLLAYQLIDSIVDHYFQILEEILEDEGEIEEKLFASFSADIIGDIYHLKKNILAFRKYVSPLKDAMKLFLNLKTPLLKRQTQLYSRDILDHIMRVTDQIDHISELASEMIDIYQSHAGNRMNEIMKTLTLVGAIFIPLTFFTGLYGMNFKNMPELTWEWGYPSLLMFFGVIAGGLLYYFYRKKWF